MKKCIAIAVALGLLLCGCGALPASKTEKPAPPPTVYYAPDHTDATQRGLQADVIASADGHTRLGRLNNLYAAQAQRLYETLGVDKLALSQLPLPDADWVRITFSTAAAEKVEQFTLYENDVVAVVDPDGKEWRCTAALGTYAAVVAYLDQVAAEQSRYFSLADGYTDDTGSHDASYTLYDAKGRSVIHKTTGSVTATVELVGEEGLVRVTDSDGIRLYAPHAARQSVLSKGPADWWEDQWAVSDGDYVAVYSLFGTEPLCRLYLAAPAGRPATVQSLAFTADGNALQVVMRDAEGSLYDRTVSVPTEDDSSVVRMVGDWRQALTPATEKEEQTIAYNILKKLRHKEKEAGYSFSAILTGHLLMGQKEHLLCELGHWQVDDGGNVTEYEPIGYLLVPADLSAGYVVEMEEDELRWDTTNNWFKK